MKIAIIGTGAYGLSLAASLNKYNELTLWTKFEEEKNQLINDHYSKNIPNWTIPDNLIITCSLSEITNSELIIIAVPAEFVESTTELIKPYVNNKHHYLIATKGIEEKSGRLIYEIVKSIIKSNNIAVLSGPSFASDIVTNYPIGLSLATKNNQTLKVIKRAFDDSNIKLRETTDIIGISLCGSIKNVIAIASGMIDGLSNNPSTRAMFITESLHDIKNMIKKLGGDGKSILSYAGFGDLLLTCTSENSRNYTFGKLLCTKSSDDIDAYKNTHTIEGLYTLKSVYKLLKNKKVDIPIINIIYNIVFKGTNPEKLLNFLMNKE